MLSFLMFFGMVDACRPVNNHNIWSFERGEFPAYTSIDAAGVKGEIVISQKDFSKDYHQPYAGRVLNIASTMFNINSRKKVLIFYIQMVDDVYAVYEFQGKCIVRKYLVSGFR